MGTEWLIWWTNFSDCQTINAACGNGEDGPSLFPSYIQKEYRGRQGRSGRCRLWVPEGCPVTEVPWNAARAICKALSYEKNSYAGILIRKEDAMSVLSYPGIVTDLNLNHVMIHDVQVPF